MQDLVNEYSLDIVESYMTHIQTCACEAVKGLLKKFSLAHHMKTIDTVSATDYLDDGMVMMIPVIVVIVIIVIIDFYYCYYYYLLLLLLLLLLL